MSLKALMRLRENVEDASWLHFTEDEHVRWSGRPSRFTIVFALVVGLVFALVGIVGTVVLMSVLNG
ncbi:hypothetical protein [Natronococcus wangiae]|uniref:hypothetical protein n=1 Tax=Natronococcus wangiae TaxID=3068275 RepID=UPI00273E0394|nr:hypothetical protein [Natronococcus sp. AD5]